MHGSGLRVLAVDDEPAVLEVLSLRIEAWGHEVAVAEDVEEAARQLRERPPEVVISDVVLPDASGLELLRRLRRDGERCPVILITAHGSVDVAVEAMKHGAWDFLLKPLDYPKLRSMLEELAAERARRIQARALETRLEQGVGLGALVGRSRAMRQVYRVLETVGPTAAPALLTGESGTGKELAARTIHGLSPRSSGPFVAINAAAIPEGLIESELFGHEQGAFTGATRSRPGCFELAQGGTLFLDEIAEMPAALQPKLLRILEDRRVRRIGSSRETALDVRVVAATNRDPAEAVRSGALREDLFYRLSVFEITLPPLRERMDDLPLLAQRFIMDCNERHGMRVEGVGPDAARRMEAYPWPGNVRELRNTIERAVIVAGEGWLEPSHLPAYLRAHVPGGEPTLLLPLGITAAEAERRLILKTLEMVGNNKAEAARRLGMDVKTVRSRLKAYARQAGA